MNTYYIGVSPEHPGDLCCFSIYKTNEERMVKILQGFPRLHREPHFLSYRHAFTWLVKLETEEPYNYLYNKTWDEVDKDPNIRTKKIL